jgi:hypothetical protein
MSDLDLSPLAIEIAKWIAKNSANGMSEPVDDKALQNAFAVPTADLKEAFAELELEDLVSLTKFIGPGIPHVRPNVMLFVEFDPDVTGDDPVADAANLADLVIKGTGQVSVAQLHQQSSWDKRRFNPALSVMLSYVDDRHISQTLQAEYPTAHFFLDETDRVELKRFVRDVNT